MTKKGNLFFLIQSLSKSEKRYFKIFCFGQKVDKNYLKLFDAIDAQEVYDEAAIRRQFAKATFIQQLHQFCIWVFRARLINSLTFKSFSL